MKEQIEKILNLFPEVTWDRWAGHTHDIVGVFGWIPREDGKSDFLVLRIHAGQVSQMTTSSSKFSADFAKRLHFGHGSCKRVEHFFQNVKAVRLDEGVHTNLTK